MTINGCFTSAHLHTLHLLLLFFSVYPSLHIAKHSSVSADAKVLCLPAEREGLFSFRTSLTDPYDRLGNWVGEDCCKWTGIRCNNQTGHVTRLDLRNPFVAGVYDSEGYKRSCLGGKLNPSLLKLNYLDYLDLSFNDFEGAQIPDFFGQFGSLKYLNLSYSSFSGEIPSQIGNLSGLQYLDLYADSYSKTDTPVLYVRSLNWLSGFSSLKHLNLGYVKLDGVGPDWLQAVNSVSTLLELRLHWCKLEGLPDSLTSINLTSLQVLDLSENSFNSPIPKWLFNLTSLTSLYLRWNFFTGHIPVEFAKLNRLEVLDLSANIELGGPVPGVFGNLSQLRVLDLSADELNGTIQEFLDGFSARRNKLNFLDMSSNSLVGELPESLGNLEKLQYLILSGNSFSGSIPLSIGSLSLLKKLDLSYNAMDGTIPESFGQLSELVDVNLMANSWQGRLNEAHLINLRKLRSFRLTTESTRSVVFNVSPKWVPPFRLETIQLENCLVGPLFPVWLQVQTQLTYVVLRKIGVSDTLPSNWVTELASQVTYMILSNNKFKGKLPQKLTFPNLRAVDLSSNSFEGPFPQWSINTSELFLQDNAFSGPLPENIGVLMPRLQKIHLSWNHFNGKIPASICDMEELQVLSLRSNRFSGELPNCWHYSLMLWAIDVSNNSLTGQIPGSFGSLPSLSVLMLSNNNLDGELPSSLQNCTGLTTIDMGGNKFSGTLPFWIKERLASLFMLRLESNLFTGNLPESICNLQNLHILDLSHNKFSGAIPSCVNNLSALVNGKNSQVFENLIYVAVKGRDPEYSSIIANVDSIDLSWNNLTGEIPDEISSLSALHILNLSHNRLSGPIPKSLSSLTSLTRLNLSYNNLAGKIPPLPRFSDPSIFEGNPSLCGAPLPTKCPGRGKF